MRPPFSLNVSVSDPMSGARRAAEALPAGGVLYYALGGGLGHLTRAEAITRQWARLTDEPFCVLTNCRFTIPATAPQLRLEDRNPDPGALGSLVRHLVQELRPRVLAVDAFPAGILGELREVLPHLPCRRISILRGLQPQWVELWSLPRLLPECYDGIATIEEGARIEGLHSELPVLEAPPVLVRDAPELLPRPDARAALEAQAGQKLLLVSVTDSRPADQGLIRLCERLGRQEGAAVRVVTPYPQGSLPGRHLTHFPLLEWLRGVDLVIGPSGYNLFHEVRATETPAIWVPQRRKYDDQFARAAHSAIARTPQELEERIRAALLNPRPPVPAYSNGASAVAEWLSGFV